MTIVQIQKNAVFNISQPYKIYIYIDLQFYLFIFKRNRILQ